MADFTIKRNDLLPPLVATLLGSDGASYQIPTDSTVTLRLRSVNPTLGIKVSSSTVTISDALQGLVQYDWQEGDTDTSGLYNFEFEVTLVSGKRITFPNYGFRTLEVVPSL